MNLDISYRSSSGDLVRAFYVPCLRETNEYRRAVGYFTSDGLSAAAQGVAHLIHNGGCIKLVASPKLSPHDINAINSGYKSREQVARDRLIETLDTIRSTLAKDRLTALAWLVARECLEVKLAFRLNAAGQVDRMYHEKFGIFSDRSGHHVAFSGSANETVGGLVGNFESIDVYWSWDDPLGRVARKLRDFRDLWENDTEGVDVLDFTAVSAEVLDRFKQYPIPETDPAESDEAMRVREPRPGSARIVLRDYQKQAVDSFLGSNGKGILEFATGAGKTITALQTAATLRDKAGLECLLVICPYRHLVSQWATECGKFGFSPILAHESRTTWLGPLQSSLVAHRAGDVITVIATNATFAGDPFQRILQHFPKKTLIVADEVHNVGARELRTKLPDSVPWRLGLSATPIRRYDDEGNARIRAYFGNTLEPQIDLRRALQMGVLTPYEYYPLLVELDDEEAEEYRKLTERMAQVLVRTADDDENPALTALLMKRARLIGTARGKLDAIRSLATALSDKTHMLFYCGDGSVELDGSDDLLRQVDAVVSILGSELGIRIAKYLAETPLGDRSDLVQALERGDIQGLVAIRCLDEGVDIPVVDTAVILASTQNPRQFIQRRGRILRRAEGKKKAVIYDMIVVPPDGDEGFWEIDRKLVRNELLRCEEFASLALNHGHAVRVLLPLRERYQLMAY